MSEIKTDSSESNSKAGPLSEGDRAKISDGLGYVLKITMGRRLAHIHDEVGTDKFVEIVGKSDKQIGRYEKGEEIPFSVVERISKETGISFGWLAYGQSITEADAASERQLIRQEIKTHRAVLAKKKIPEIDRIISEFALEHWEFVLAEHEAFDQRRAAARLQVPELDHLVMVTIPRYDEVRPSAGHGSVATSEIPTTRIAVEQGWLTEMGVKPESAVILPAQGDSMEPTIMNGAPMLVDTSKKEVRNGFIYVFDVAGDLMVKRIERLPDGTINLLSDNSEKYPARNLDIESVGRMTVIGRVYAAVSKF